MIMDVYTLQKNAFKISLGFAYVLYDTVTGEFPYFYNSSNNFLFKEAITISDRTDVDKLMDVNVGLDLATNYYLSNPSSSWVMAGLTNVKLDIYILQNVLIGAPPTDLPDYLYIYI